MTLHLERLVADLDDELVVYINGMRLNKPRSVVRWIRAGRKLTRMFDRLEADPESGFLGYQPAFMGLRTGAAIQYWRSLEDLLAFARDPDDLHVPAWEWFDRVAADGGVGFWAELYVVGADDVATFFRNVGDVGLGRAVPLVPASDVEGLDLGREA